MTEVIHGVGAEVTDFELSPSLAEFRAKARAFAETELAPHAPEWDRGEIFPREQLLKAGAQGFLSITIPKEYGGTELGNLASCIMLEELNAACPSFGVTVSVHNSLFCSMLGKWGSDAQKQAFFPRMLSGENLGAYCLSEAGAGSDAAALQCEAKKDGDDWVLNGAKLWITTGSEAEAFIVFARTGEDRVNGISAFLVEKGPGVAVGKKERKLGLKASPTVEILLDNCRVPGGNLVGEEGVGFRIALDTLDGGRLGIASQALGIAKACTELIKTHLRTNVDAKGRPISPQSHQWTLADLATSLEAGRLLTWKAAVLRDRHERCTREAAMAKSFCSRLANEAARQAVRILGVDGASGATAAERHLRDARITEIYEGVTDIQRLVIARAELAE